ncbi:GNAT family N-acetyltransferase [Pseudothauera rhizosphaerae]|uniref:GNAT family N-acetyltransferase n=1 Tax=Pseudothauera rhizosphaerae TaxID=2565932 RepID=A0A4S4AM91_9RHOO|nr:GNAT family N-acetyltransferase [Pseudothauera rhizosphaerae]THF60688.1 GNAT family N-acetyltransferase [Pseudothauera rhizosphaerae]
MSPSLLHTPGEVPGGVLLRPLRAANLAEVLRLQACAYPAEYHERAEVFASRLALAPGGCWLGERGGRAAGYVIAHPWCGVQPPQLHVPLDELPAAGAAAVFLHDMAVCPQARGSGLAQALFRKVRAWAAEQEAREIMLVALADARGFWQRLGFVADPRPLPACYGDGACCMRLALPAR